MVFKSRRAAPLQLDQLRELAAETQTGAFGMPTSTQIETKWDIHVYELIVVRIMERLRPTGYRHPAEVVEHLDFEPVLFKPSLEVALGQRTVRNAAYSSGGESAIEEAEEARIRRGALYGHDPHHLHLHEIFDSAFAKLRGGFLLSLSVTAVLPNTHPTEEYSVDYAIQTPATRLGPQLADLDSHLSLQSSPRASGYRRRFDTDHRPPRRDIPRLRFSRHHITRSDADAAIADLRAVKDTYSTFLPH